MAKNPYLDTLPTSLAFLGAKRLPEMFFSLFQTIFFLILELKEASGGSENFQNGLCMAKNPYFDPSHTSLALRGAKWWQETFLGYFLGVGVLFGVPTPSPYLFYILKIFTSL